MIYYSSFSGVMRVKSCWDELKEWEINDVERSSINYTRCFAGKGNKEIDIGWDMKLKRFPDWLY